MAETVELLLHDKQTDILEQDLQLFVQFKHELPLTYWLDWQTHTPPLRTRGEAHEVHELADVHSKQFDEQLTQAFPSPLGACPAGQEQAELERENPE